MDFVTLHTIQYYASNTIEINIIIGILLFLYMGYMSWEMENFSLKTWKEEWNHLGHIVVDRKIILKWILK
jgi:hypothetical protein